MEHWGWLVALTATAAIGIAVVLISAQRRRKAQAPRNPEGRGHDDLDDRDPQKLHFHRTVAEWVDRAIIEHTPRPPTPCTANTTIRRTGRCSNQYALPG